MTKYSLPTANPSDGGILVPTYAELAQYTSGALPPTPAAGKTRLYADSNGQARLLDPTGTTRRIATHWGNGTSFPTLAANPSIGYGDTYFRTDIGSNGSLWQYTVSSQGISGWICEAPIVCANAAAMPGLLYAGAQVYRSDLGYMLWSDGTTRWRKMPSAVPTLIGSQPLGGGSGNIAPGSSRIYAGGYQIPAHQAGPILIDIHAMIGCTNILAGLLDVAVGSGGATAPANGSATLSGSTRFHNNGNVQTFSVSALGYYDSDGTSRIAGVMFSSDSGSSSTDAHLIAYSIAVWQL